MGNSTKSLWPINTHIDCGTFLNLLEELDLISQLSMKISYSWHAKEEYRKVRENEMDFKGWMYRTPQSSDCQAEQRATLSSRLHIKTGSLRALGKWAVRSWEKQGFSPLTRIMLHRSSSRDCLSGDNSLDPAWGFVHVVVPSETQNHSSCVPHSTALERTSISILDLKWAVGFGEGNIRFY